MPILASFALASCSIAALAAPTPLAQEPAPRDDTLLVLNKSDDTLDFFDPFDGAKRGTLPTGAGPHEVAVSPDGARAVVGNYGRAEGGNTLSVYDLAGPKLERTIVLEGYQRPHGLAFLGPHRILVTAESQQSLLEVDLREGRVVRDLGTAQAASHMVVAAPDGGRAYVTNIVSGTLTAFDLETGARLANVPTGAGAEGVDVTPDGAEIWVANREADTVSVVAADTLEVVEQLPCSDFPIRLKVTPDGRHALVSNAYSAEVVVFDVAERAELVRIPMEVAAAEGSAEHLIVQGNSPVPIGIVIEPSGRRAFVANTNANLITVIDLQRFEIASRIPAGNEPDGLAWVAASAR